jgi:hypothetical protein
MGELICPHCGYGWQPRVTTPKECPSCKQNLTRSERSKKARIAAAQSQSQEQQQHDLVELLLSTAAEATSNALTEFVEHSHEPSLATLSDEELQALRKPNARIAECPATQELVRRMRAKGMGCRPIAQTLGIGKTAVSTWRD